MPTTQMDVAVSANTGNIRNTAHAQPGTRAERLAAELAGRIHGRTLLPGARLPSVRDCAARQGLSPSTVVAAYDLLQAQGLVQARPQRGFFVRDARPAAHPCVARGLPGPPGVMAAVHSGSLPLRPDLAPEAPPLDATALIRGMFHPARQRTGSSGGGPGMGTLPPAWLDAPLLQRALRRATSGPAAAAAWLTYGDPAGDLALREALVPHLAGLGLPAVTPGHIVTTQGATQALDIVARTLLAPGDAVLVDEPGWAVEFARLARQGLRVLPVPRREQGPDLAVLAQLLVQHRPRLYVTMPVLHNPTGGSFSPALAHGLMKLAEAHDLLLVEDDTYAWLAAPHATRLAQLDAAGTRTIYVSGFSKVLAPQWRVGFIAAAPALAQRFIDTKLLGGLTTPASFERAVAHTLAQGHLRRHAERLTQRLAAARQRSVRLVREAGCDFVTPPQGLFGWIDTHTDTEVLAEKLLAEGFLTAPGSLFHARHTPGTLMRINFATAQEARFWHRLVALRT